jgi:hypothetical protein
MRSEIAEKHESWMALPKNDRRDYKVMWVMTNGHRGIGNEFLEEQLKEVA